MEKFDYKSEELKLRKKLFRMKLIATSLLVFMIIVFIVFRRFESRGLLFSSITAFAEASMVGALADWFAVVALFKHPLGLKIIPHTAIIQNNKQRIAKALSNFVVSNFFTPELIKSKLDKINISSKITEYVSDNRDKIAGEIAVRLPELLDSVIDEGKVKEYIKHFANRKVDEIKLYPLLGKLMSPAVEAGHHKPLVKSMLVSTYNFIGDNKDKTMLVLGGINKTLMMPFIGDLIYKKILDYLLEQIQELDTNDEAEINKLVMSALPKLFNDMQEDEELISKGEQLKSQIMASGLYQQVLEQICKAAIELKTAFMDKDRLYVKVSGLLNLLVEKINENAELRKSIDTLAIDTAEGVVSIYGDKVGELIYDTMDSWETKDMVDKLEVQVGADLQYIRINGTVIGGLAGLAIHLLTQLF